MWHPAPWFVGLSESAVASAAGALRWPGLARRSGDAGDVAGGSVPLRARATAALPRSGRASLISCAKLITCVIRSHFLHTRTIFCTIVWIELVYERRGFEFVDKWASLQIAESVVIQMQYNLVVRESAWRHRDRPERSYVEHGCSDGMWPIVVTCNGTVPLFTWSAVAPPRRESFTGTMRRKRWARMRRAW